MKIYVLVMIMTAITGPKKEATKTIFSAYKTMQECEKNKKFYDNGTMVVVGNTVYKTTFQCGLTYGN